MFVFFAEIAMYLTSYLALKLFISYVIATGETRI